MNHALAIVIAALVSCVACASSKPIGVSTRIPEGADALVDFPDDDADGVSKGDACSTAYRILRSCHCKEAQPIMGDAFPGWCRSMGYAVDSSCVANVRFCGDLPACHVRCEK